MMDRESIIKNIALVGNFICIVDSIVRTRRA